MLAGESNNEIIYCECCDQYYCCNKSFWDENDESYCSDCWTPRDPDYNLPAQPSWNRN